MGLTVKEIRELIKEHVDPDLRSLMESMNQIPYGKQNITEEDIAAVTISLKGDFLTQGPTIFEFEQKFANYVDAKFAVAVSNGTAALHFVLLALECG